VAAFIDLIVLGAVFVAFTLLFGDREVEDGQADVSLTGAPFLVWLLLALAYYAGFEWLKRATPGKLAMSLRVAPVSGDLTMGRVLIRTALRVIDVLPFLYVLGLVVVAVTKRNQRLGDLAANTVVVRAGGEPPLDS
jgi:uncharacterized RDD family membrane protein YckC